MNFNKESVKHFQEKTGGLQLINWVDIWLYSNGYRISHAGGIIPERYWVKDDKNVNVRNYEVQFSNRIPSNENELTCLLSTGQYPKQEITDKVDREYTRLVVTPFIQNLMDMGRRTIANV